MSGAGWGGGYITDIDYMPGWYVQQSPMHLAVTCLLLGIACDLPAGEEDVHYMELGCGLGFGAMVLAASNPSWRITAVDFNPAHIAQARAVARDAGLGNIAFLEADLATLAEEEGGKRLPQVDFVSLHGVWSWVSPAVRAGIVRLLRAKVAPGGVVHISYNALPAWQSGIGMQRLLLSAGDVAGGASDRRANAGLAMLRALMAAEATHLHGSMVPRRMIERFDKLPVPYVTHEYMNRAWSPCFHADVAADLAAAKLDWVGSASLLENYANLSLTESQQAVYAETQDPMLRELIKDLCMNRALRHDVYTRGVQRITPATRDAALRDLTLALTVPAEDAAFEIEVGAGTVTLSSDYYRPILRTLEAGPRRVADLLDQAARDGRSSDPRELVGMLLGIEHVMPMLRPDMAPAAGAERFNRVAARWLLSPSNYTRSLALASVAAGGGVPATIFDMFIGERSQAGEGIADLERWVDELAAPVEAMDREPVRMMLTRGFERRLPLLRAAGVL